MEELVLTNENYYSVEANMEYMSASQFKDFYMGCEVDALAKAKGERVEPKTDALLLGSYIDAYFSGELQQFIQENAEYILDSRSKEPKLRVMFQRDVAEIIKAIEEDEMLMHYLSGKHQVIMTGVIGGVKFKIKVDSLLEDAIVDQKIMSSIRELVWKYDEETKKNKQLDFVEAFGYQFQGAIYQEIVRQNIGRRLPFILAPTTKEENPDKALIQIDQEYLDRALEIVKEYAERYYLIKKGIIAPVGCDNCPSCRKDKKITQIVSYKDLFKKGVEEHE